MPLYVDDRGRRTLETKTTMSPKTTMSWERGDIVDYVIKEREIIKL
jgi:hypothetical protein